MSILPPFKPENKLQIEKIIEKTSTPLLQNMHVKIVNIIYFIKLMKVDTNFSTGNVDKNDDSVYNPNWVDEF